MWRLASVLMLSLLSVRFAGSEPNRTYTPAKAALYKKLTHGLIAPCCWREPIAIHLSEESLQMQAEVEQLVEAGRSEQEIKALYVSRYGVRILADPPGSERHWLYYTPLFVLTGAVVVLGFRLSALVQPPATSEPVLARELLDRVRKEVERRCLTSFAAVTSTAL